MQDKSHQSRRSEGRSLSLVFPDSTIAGYDDPNDIVLGQILYPFKIGCVTSTGQIFDVDRFMPQVFDKPVKG